MNKNPPSEAKAATAITVAEANGVDRKKRTSMSGSARRGSHASRPTRDRADRAKAVRMTGDVTPWPGASMIP